MTEKVAFSTFDGISCFQLALNRARAYVDRYYASEINQDTIGITQFHYPMTQQLGDICKIDGKPFKGKVSIYAGGSPCQSFSNAGIRNGFDGKSKLFFEWLRLKEEMEPEFWILENVWMKKEWQKVISDLLGVEPIFINSRVASGQNRPRLYWTNIPYTPIEDKGILLGDVIPGAITGASKHGILIPEHLRVPGGPKWKNDGWKFNVNNKANCLVLSTGHYKNIMGDIKKITPENAELLQTIPLGYTGVTGLPKTKRIQAIGNAWTVDVLVEAFFKNLPWAIKSELHPTGKFSKV
jgi:DNA (cytosine-5)-methyltransferase 3A